MKLVTYQSGRQLRVGVVEGQNVVDVRVAVDLATKKRGPRALYSESKFKSAAQTLAEAGAAPREMLGVLTRGEEWLKALDCHKRFGQGIDRKAGSQKFSCQNNERADRAARFRPLARAHSPPWQNHLRGA